MGEFLESVARHGGAALFLFSVLENAGVPFPALPVLMLAGALAQSGRLSPVAAVAGAVAGALLADASWYGIGRWRGRGLLSSLCRATLNPDACVERTEHGFHDRPAATIVFSKFLPGVNTLVPPLAGILPMPFPRFLLLDAAGALVWAAAGVGIGWLFGAEIAERARAMQGMLFWIFAGGLCAYLAWRVGYRYYLVHRYSVPRIEPEDLHRRLAAGEELLVVDLRGDDPFASSETMIPGARRARPATFHRAAHDLPLDREIVFYCT